MPLAETASQIPGNAFEHNGGDRHERPVFHAGGEDGILLRKVERIVERGVLRLSGAPDDDVHLEEGVEDVDFAGRKVGLAEGADFDDLCGHID